MCIRDSWVVSYKTRLLQLERQSRHYAPALSRVVVRENQQGELAILYRGHRLGFKEIFLRAATAAAGGSRARLGCGPPSTIPGNNPSNRKLKRSSMQLHNFIKGTFLLSARRGHF